MQPGERVRLKNLDNLPVNQTKVKDIADVFYKYNPLKTGVDGTVIATGRKYCLNYDNALMESHGKPPLKPTILDYDVRVEWDNGFRNSYYWRNLKVL